jgi:SAM-dependent methyltransferase
MRLRALAGRVRARLRRRFARERPKAWLSPVEEALVPPRRLWIGPQDSIHHYYRWVWEYLAYLVLLCDLRRDARVLELGCGHGRTARGLIDYLRAPGGQYRGLDVSAERVADAQARIQARYPNFRFLHADVFNADYHAAGRVAAAEYVFPFEAATFDVVYAASLFTHLLPAEAGRYLEESARVLKPGGRCLFSFFLLEHYGGPGTTISPLYEPAHELAGQAGVRVRDLENPGALVAYRLELVERLAGAAGLRVAKVWPGLWCERPGAALNEQDLVLLDRA